MTSLLTDDRTSEMKGEPSVVPTRAPAGAAKTFRAYDSTQSFLLSPPSTTGRTRITRPGSLPKWPFAG